jgi:HlyD family secretion protein
VTTNEPTPNASARPAPPRRRPPILPLVLIALGVVGYVGYDRYRATRPFEWSGTVEARTIDVGSRAGGRVKEVLVHEGDHVTAGQVLLVLEPGDLDAQRLMAEAQLDQAQATLDKLKSGARPEEIEQAKARASTAEASLAEAENGARKEEIAAATARLAATQAALDKAKLDADRAHELFAANAIPRSEVDAAESGLRGATAQRDAAQETLAELRHGARSEQIQQAQSRAKEALASAKLVEAGARVEDLRAAEAAVKAARGRLDQVTVLLNELSVRASEAARVETLDLRPGDILAPNATAATLLEDDQLFVRIYVPETQIGHIHPGDKVPVFVDSFPDRPFEGVVEHIDMQGQYSPRNLQTADERANQVFAARVGLHDDERDLRAGMAALLRVPK